MYHWYILIRNRFLPDHLVQEFDREDAGDPATKEVRKKWFWLGLIEATPILVGIVCSAFHQVYFAYDYLALGFVLSIVIAWKLKDRSPEPPIHIRK